MSKEVKRWDELKALAEAFPSDLDWDSNTDPFFNGPTGESMGGGPDGTYAVYGKPFRLEGEDYDYDGPTYVERCNVEFAKFMVSARDGVLALLAERDALLAERDAYRKALEKLATVPGCGCSFPCRCDGEEWTRAELEDRMDYAAETLARAALQGEQS